MGGRVIPTAKAPRGPPRLGSRRAPRQGRGGPKTKRSPAQGSSPTCSKVRHSSSVATQIKTGPAAGRWSGKHRIGTEQHNTTSGFFCNLNLQRAVECENTR